MSVAVRTWFAAEGRDLPWRDPGTSAWAILVSEFMLQQTQVERVLPRWEAWISRWPLPSALAAEPPGEAVRAWDRLGYPRRALWLHRAATSIAEDHDDVVPRDLDDLLGLPGVGPYTARAVAVFAHGERHPVVDTNTRRVIARVVHGRAAAGMPAARDLIDMAAILPTDRQESVQFNAAMMELGALVCTARAPRCDACPLAAWCEWRGAGYPENAPTKRPRQAAFSGSDRQARGRILTLLRDSHIPVPCTDALAAAREHASRDPKRDDDQPSRALTSLITDGLVVVSGDMLSLP